MTPLHDGPSTLSVLVDVQGNFLQRLELTFDIGTTAPVDMTNFGRPAGAALVMEPRTASMQFMPATGGYDLFVKGVTDQPVFIQITEDELAARIESVREALLAIVKQPAFALEIDIPASSAHRRSRSSRSRASGCTRRSSPGRSRPRSSRRSAGGCERAWPRTSRRSRSSPADSRFRGR